MVNLYTKTMNIELNGEVFAKKYGKRLYSQLKRVCDNNLEVVYVQAGKHKDASNDEIGFYSPKLHKYVLIPIANLATATTSIPDDLILKESKSVLSAVLSKKDMIDIKHIGQIEPDVINIVKTKIIAKNLRKGLEVISRHVILDKNFWINVAIKQLRVRPPKEEEITERYIKTIKIYYLAFQVGRNIPVALLRTCVNNLSYLCYDVEEIPTLKEVTELKSDFKTYENQSKKVIKKEIHNIEIKCQSAYPLNVSTPTIFIPGVKAKTYSHNGKLVNGKHESDTIIGENVAFVVKIADTVYNLEGIDKFIKEKTSCDKLLVYVPIAPEKKVVEVTSINSLCEVAYSMAISLNYPLVRIDFK